MDATQLRSILSARTKMFKLASSLSGCFYLTMTEHIGGISPFKSFYDRLSEDERLALRDSEGWLSELIDTSKSLEEQQYDSIAIATRFTGEMPLDAINLGLHHHMTLLKIDLPSRTFIESFAHEYVLDLTKLKPVEYGMSNDALISSRDEWTVLEWNKAKHYAFSLSPTLRALDASQFQEVKVEVAQIKDGEQVRF